MTETAEILKTILQHKREEVEQRKSRHSIQELKDRAADQDGPRGFALSLSNRVARSETAVIAELKRASPSKGVLREDFDPLSIARSYMMAGAVCLSVLTDSRFFMGSGIILDLVRKHCPLPVLRKDFIIDPYQIHESRAYGADCILLIAAALQVQQLRELFDLATENVMDVMVEVHTEEELETALDLGDSLRLIGINNRNLCTFEVSLDTTFTLARQVPDSKLVISESGIRSNRDIQRLAEAGIHACLIGEVLMSAEDPGAKLAECLKPPIEDLSP